MRRILFRGKCIDNNNCPFSGTLVYGDLNIWEDGPYIASRKTAYCHQVDPETVGQYTGLFDKNGKKIFEGDIVKWQTVGLEYKIMTIEFYRGGYIAVPVDPELRRPIIRLGNEQEYCEVIGNIHDNPELLKGEY